jgi:hypothetical protein
VPDSTKFYWRGGVSSRVELRQAKERFQGIVGGEEVTGLGRESEPLANLLNVSRAAVPSWRMSCSWLHSRA